MPTLFVANKEKEKKPKQKCRWNHWISLFNVLLCRKDWNIYIQKQQVDEKKCEIHVAELLCAIPAASCLYMQYIRIDLYFFAWILCKSIRT